MSISTAEATYNYKKLFHMACGYISGTEEWKEKHPQEVVDFFLNNYIDLPYED